MKYATFGFAVAAAVLSLGTTASAQPTPTRVASRMSIGAGIAQSSLIGSDAERFGLDNNLTGFYIGLATDIPIIGTVVRVAPGARYIARGYTLSSADKSSYRLNYLEAVAPVVIEIPLAGTVALHLSGGPGVGLSMGCKIKTTTADGVQRALDCQNDELFYHGYDFNAFGGAGLSFGLPNNARLLVNGSLDQSLKSIDSSGDDLDYRNRSILIGGQVTFPMGRRGR